jgi:hypothetical protein
MQYLRNQLAFANAKNEAIVEQNQVRITFAKVQVSKFISGCTFSQSPTTTWPPVMDRFQGCSKFFSTDFVESAHQLDLCARSESLRSQNIACLRHFNNSHCLILLN